MCFLCIGQKLKIVHPQEASLMVKMQKDNCSISPYIKTKFVFLRENILKRDGFSNNHSWWWILEHS